MFASVVAASATKEGDALPSVCVMITTNGRPEFARHALRMVSKQDYPRWPIEVVVVDDSAHALQMEEVPASEIQQLTVTYLRPKAQLAVGEKRNLAAVKCTADVVVHWDDDDFYGPLRLREQVGPLARNEGDITVFKHKYTYFIDKGTAYAVNEEVLPDWGPHCRRRTLQPQVSRMTRTRSIAHSHPTAPSWHTRMATRALLGPRRPLPEHEQGRRLRLCAGGRTAGRAASARGQLQFRRRGTLRLVGRPV